MSLLFTDGFESANIGDIYRKWGNFFPYANGTKPNTSEPNYQLAIVSGNDPVSGKPLARKGGKALYLPSVGGNQHRFFLPFEKSRTVYLGFALRVKASCSINISFATGCPPNIVPNRVYGFYPGNGANDTGSLFRQQSFLNNYASPADTEMLGLAPPPGYYGGRHREGLLVASYSSTINQNNVSCRWDFPSIESIPVQIGSVNHNANAFLGDYFYYQVGFTLLGNNPIAGNSSWVESRIGNRLDKRWFQQCQTCNPGSDRSFYVSALVFDIIPSNNSAGVWLDDFYLANDEGDCNNDFLGSVFVRNSYVSTQGSKNDGVVYNCLTENRGDAVRGRFVNTQPSIGVTDLNAIGETGDNPFSSGSFDLNKEGDEQTLLFAPIHYFGAQPNIKACVLYSAMVRRTADLLHPFVSAYFRYGSEVQYFSNPSPRAVCGFTSDDVALPLYYEEVRRFVIENKEGPLSPTFNAEHLNSSEFGFVLNAGNPVFEDYSELLIRKRLVLNESVSDVVSLEPYSSRYVEELVVSSMSLSCLPVRDWGGSVDESLIFFDGSLQALGYQHLLSDPLRIEDSYSEYSQNVSSWLPIVDDVTLSYHCFVSSSFSAEDTSYGVWVEEFREVFSVVSESFNGIAFFVGEDLSIIESDLFDGHLDAIEDISLLSSYVWDGHESADEYVGLSSFAQDALIEFVDSLIEYEEDHFDGFWVEQFDMRFGLSDSILTQQWRHEWFMGILINSWQIGPIEDPGMDGYRVGDYDKIIFGGA